MSTREVERNSVSLQPEPRIYNGDILELTPTTVYSQIRINIRPYRDGVADTCPVFNVAINRTTGLTKILGRVTINHSWPDRFGIHRGLEDPRNGGYTSVYENGHTTSLPLFVKNRRIDGEEGSTLVITEGGIPDGKNALLGRDRVAYRPDVDRKSIVLINREDLKGQNVLEVDPLKSLRINFGEKDRFPDWCRDVIGLTSYDTPLEEDGFALFHGQRIDTLCHYGIGWALREQGKMRLARQPLFTGPGLDAVTGEPVETSENRGKKVPGKDVVYQDGLKTEVVNNRKTSLVMLVTRHDDHTYLMETPYRETLERWNEGSAHWSKALRVHLHSDSYALLDKSDKMTDDKLPSVHEV